MKEFEEQGYCHKTPLVDESDEQEDVSDKNNNILTDELQMVDPSEFLEPIDSDIVNLAPGLLSQHYQGTWSKLPDFSKLVPDAEEIVDRVGLGQYSNTSLENRRRPPPKSD